MRQNYSFSKNGNALLEPCEGKLSCTVLRGESPSNGADLLDTKLIYAIGAVIGLIGGVKVYSKFSSGDPATSKTAASWFGAQPGVQGTQEPVPVHLCRRVARPVRGVRHHVHGRHRPVGLHRFRGHLRIGAGLGDLQHEHEIRRMGAYETPCAAQPSPLHHQPEKVPPVVFFNY